MDDRPQRRGEFLRVNCPIADAMNTEAIVMVVHTATIAITTDADSIPVQRGPSTWNDCRRSTKGCKRSRTT